mmetsp:Transcript_6880/g.17246  ORF Transcript_6880/g.17246 Transcript_6880/m.17246 type:complete len:372 (+) Transcript_6880:410-1525(+)
MIIVVFINLLRRRTIQGRRRRGRGPDLRRIDGIHVVELDQVAERLPVLLFVVPDVAKDVVQRVELRAALAVGGLGRLGLDGAKQIKEERIVLDVVPGGNLRDRSALEAVLVLGGELAVGVKGVVLDELRQVVGGGLVPGVNDNDVPVVEKGHGLREGSVDDVGVSSQALHDEEVVELVVGLGVVGAHSIGHAVVSLPKGLSKVHDAEVGEIGDPCHRFQNVKAGKIALGALDRIQKADNVVYRVDEYLVEIVDPFVHGPGREGRGRCNSSSSSNSSSRCRCFHRRHRSGLGGGHRLCRWRGGRQRRRGIVIAIAVLVGGDGHTQGRPSKPERCTGCHGLKGSNHRRGRRCCQCQGGKEELLRRKSHGWMEG